MAIQYNPDYRLIGQYQQPEITPMGKRLSDIATLADLITKAQTNQLSLSEAQKKAEAAAESAKEYAAQLEALRKSNKSAPDFTNAAIKPRGYTAPEAPINHSLEAVAPAQAVERGTDPYGSINENQRYVNPNEYKGLPAPTGLMQTPWGPTNPDTANALMGQPVKMPEFKSNGLPIEALVQPQTPQPEPMAPEAQAPVAAAVQAAKAQTAVPPPAPAPMAPEEERVPEAYRKIFDPTQYKNFLVLSSHHPDVGAEYLKNIVSMRKTVSDINFQEGKTEHLGDKAAQAALSSAANLAAEIKTATSPVVRTALYESMYNKLISGGADVSSLPTPNNFDSSNPAHIAMVEPVAALARTTQQKVTSEEKGKVQTLAEKKFGLEGEKLAQLKRYQDEYLKIMWARVNKPDGTGFGGSVNMTPEETDALNRAVSEGRLQPYKINSRTAKIFASMERSAPGTDWNNIQAAGSYEVSPQVSAQKTLLKAIDPMYEDLLAAGKALGNTDNQFLNEGINYLKEKTGDPAIVAFNNLRDGTIAEVEKGLLGTGVLSDSKYNREINNIRSAQSYPQLEAAVKATKKIVKARLEAIEKGPGTSAIKPKETISDADADALLNKYRTKR